MDSNYYSNIPKEVDKNKIITLSNAKRKNSNTWTLPILFLIILCCFFISPFQIKVIFGLILLILLIPIIKIIFDRKTNNQDEECLSRVQINYSKIYIFNHHTKNSIFYLDQIEKVKPHSFDDNEDKTIYIIKIKDKENKIHLFYFIPFEESLNILKTYISRYKKVIISESKKT